MPITFNRALHPTHHPPSWLKFDIKQKNMKTILAIIPITIALLLSGCQTTTVKPASAVPHQKLTRGSSIYIATPNDGSYRGRPYKGSGAIVAVAFEGAFTRYADSVIVGEGKNSISETLNIAKDKKCIYAVIPRITRWEDRATEWSGKRDKMELYVKVIRIEDNVEMARVEIIGRSAWATFGGDHPEDLVKAPVDEFVASLF